MEELTVERTITVGDLELTIYQQPESNEPVYKAGDVVKAKSYPWKTFVEGRTWSGKVNAEIPDGTELEVIETFDQYVKVKFGRRRPWVRQSAVEHI